MTAKSALQQEAKAWREIAATIAERGLDASGLCKEIDLHTPWPNPLNAAMGARIRVHTAGQGWMDGDGDDESCMGSSAGSERAENRLLFALLLSAQCDDEARRHTHEKAAVVPSPTGENPTQ